MADFTSLSPYIKGRIFLRLSHLGLLSWKLRLVSKSWNSLIVPIKFQSWDIKKLDDNMDPEKLKQKTWPDTWVYLKIKKYTKSIMVRNAINGDVAGFLSGLKKIDTIDIVPDQDYQGSQAWDNIAEPIFSRWLPNYMARLTSISLFRVKLIEFLEVVHQKDISRLRRFVTDSYCSEDHGKTPYLCIRTSRMLVKFIGSYRTLQELGIRVTDTDSDLSQALVHQRRQLRILRVRDIAPSIKPSSTTFNLSPRSLRTLASSYQSLTRLTVDLPAELFFLGNTLCAIDSDGMDSSIMEWIQAVAAFKLLRQLYMHTYSFQTWQLHRGRVQKFDNHDKAVEAAARELFTHLTFAKEGRLFDEMEIRYKVFRGKEAPPHSTPRKGISVVNCWLYKYVSSYYSWNGVRQGLNGIFSRETLGYDAWPEP